MLQPLVEKEFPEHERVLFLNPFYQNLKLRSFQSNWTYQNLVDN